MSKNLVKAMGKPDKKILPLAERVALNKLRKEAKAAGAMLTSAGSGGLPPSFVLGVMRRDEYTCKVHGDKGEGENGGLQVHHKGGLDNPNSPWLKSKAKRNDLNNVVTLCKRAHNEIHEKDNAISDQQEEAEQ